MDPAIARLTLNARGPLSPHQLSFWQGVEIELPFAIFEDGSTTVLETDFSDVVSVHLEVYDGRSGGGELLMEAPSILGAALNGSMTLPQWTAKTHQHGTFTLSSEQMNQYVRAGVRECWVVIYALKTGGGRDNLGAGQFQIYRNRGVGAGQPPSLVYTKSEVDALVDAIVPAATRVFANDAARNAATPVYVGQMGYQTDTGLTYIGMTTTAGDWRVSTHIRYVRTQTELLAALPGGGTIGVVGIISTTPASITVDNTILLGIRTPSGVRGGISVPHVNGAARSAITVSAKNVAILDLDISNNHPLASDTTTIDVGITLSTSDIQDISGLRIEGCKIHDTGYGIYRGWNADSVVANDIHIDRNEIVSFLQFGIYLRFNTPRAKVTNNIIFGREVGETHATTGNGMWIGNNANYCHITNNVIARVGRHAIEYWNSQDLAATTSGNESGYIAGNVCTEGLKTPYDPEAFGNVSFGISAFGAGVGMLRVVDNVIRGYTIGIELYNDPVNTSRIYCAGNHVKDFVWQAISLDNCINVTVLNNLLEQNVAANSQGIQLARGCCNIVIKHNTFINAGTSAIRLHGREWEVRGVSTQAVTGYAIITVRGPTYRLGAQKWMHFFDLGGMTALNGKTRQIYSIGTPVLVSGDTYDTPIVVAVDISAQPAWTSGGKMHEQFEAINISDNDIYLTTQLYPGGFVAAIWAYYVQSIVLKNNTRFVNEAMQAVFFMGSLYCSHRGTIYTGSAAEAPFAVTSGDLEIPNGSNILVPIT